MDFYCHNTCAMTKLDFNHIENMNFVDVEVQSQEFFLNKLKFIYLF